MVTSPQGKQQHIHVIVIGDTEDWQADRGSIYYVEDKRALRCLLVFTSPNQAMVHIKANLAEPPAQGYMDMVEGSPASHIEALIAGRYGVVEVSWPEGLAEIAAEIEADYLLRNPRPGSEQEIMPLTERAKAQLEYGRSDN